MCREVSFILVIIQFKSVLTPQEKWLSTGMDHIVLVLLPPSHNFQSLQGKNKIILVWQLVESNRLPDAFISAQEIKL